MSEASLDLREQIARIDRNQAESSKFQEEMRKLSLETVKLAAESAKLSAEERKLYEEGPTFRRDRLVQPIVALAALLGGLGGIVTLLQLIIRAGVRP